MKITQLTKGRIAQWVANDEIPRAWLMLFHKMHPKKIPSPDASATNKRQGRRNT